MIIDRADHPFWELSPWAPRTLVIDSKSYPNFAFYWIEKKQSMTPKQWLKKRKEVLFSSIEHGANYEFYEKLFATAGFHLSFEKQSQQATNDISDEKIYAQILDEMRETNEKGLLSPLIRYGFRKDLKHHKKYKKAVEKYGEKKQQISDHSQAMIHQLERSMRYQFGYIDFANSIAAIDQLQNLHNHFPALADRRLVQFHSVMMQIDEWIERKKLHLLPVNRMLEFAIAYLVWSELPKTCKTHCWITFEEIQARILAYHKKSPSILRKLPRKIMFAFVNAFQDYKALYHQFYLMKWTHHYLAFPQKENMIYTDWFENRYVDRMDARAKQTKTIHDALLPLQNLFEKQFPKDCFYEMEQTVFQIDLPHNIYEMNVYRSLLDHWEMQRVLMVYDDQLNHEKLVDWISSRSAIMKNIKTIKFSELKNPSILDRQREFLEEKQLIIERDREKLEHLVEEWMPIMLERPNVWFRTKTWWEAPPETAIAFRILTEEEEEDQFDAEYMVAEVDDTDSQDN